MQRAGRWSRGRRLTAAALAGAAAAVASGGSAAAQSAAVPTLTGEKLIALVSISEEADTGAFKMDYGCRAPGEPPRSTMTIPFSGPTPPEVNWFGPGAAAYPGRFSARFDASLAAPVATGPEQWSCRLTAATVSFAIDSPRGQVTGTATLDSERPAAIVGSGNPLWYMYQDLDATFRYTAQIVTAEGQLRSDRGTYAFRFSFGGSQSSDDHYIATAFTSALEAAEPLAPLAGDTTPPVVKAPYFPFTSAPLAGDPVSATRNKVTWSAADPAGVCRHELQRSVDGGAFAPVPLATATSKATVQQHTLGRRYKYRVRATDCAGNRSTFKPAPAFTAHVEDADADGPLVISSGWRQLQEPGHYNSTLLSASFGGTATYVGAARRIALIVPREPGGSYARLIVDGVYWPMIHLNRDAPAPANRRVIWQRAWTSSAEHRLGIVADPGTGFEIDAIATLR